LLLSYFIWQVGSFFLNWAIFDADFLVNFQGEEILDRTYCSKILNLVCMELVGQSLMLDFINSCMVLSERRSLESNFYTFLLLPLALVGIFFDKLPYRKFFIYFTFIYPFIAYFTFYGGPTLTQVGTNKWGGLLVTLFLGVTGIGLAFPLSILLALGRRSQMPIISSMCVVFIEFIRGVPLITLLIYCKCNASFIFT